ncbi:MAG: ABC transporter permease [Chloroflexi bacterium]|nr:ABC transporter permease [Chloroflexota bacterium]MCI0575816.1 ABC transporter permease [Chloroflexota bacterium]MCI0646543.1 ABC transporter permease [Chloroflexota bacterium]MCI0726345.1 ABC transporter permease [Chloroflexota bacterium]
MKKVLTIGWKDLIVTFRDRAALIMMLAAPLVLTLGMGFVTGSFSQDDSSGLADIPVVVVNEDEGQLGQALAQAFASPELAELVEPTTAGSFAAARQQVDDDEVAAAVLIPAGFSAGVIPGRDGGAAGQAVAIEVYANPARPLSAGVVQAIVNSFASQVRAGQVSGQVAITQLIMDGLISPQEAPTASQAMVERMMGEDGGGQALIALHRSSATVDEEETFNPLAFFATGMAVFFLMYTVTIGGRSILDERNARTLSRLLTTPTSLAQVLGGKVLGVFLTGFTQVIILIVATSLMFNLRWGDALGVIVLVAAVAAAATGWGILLAALAKSAGQISSLGTALMLIFGIMGGTFISLANFSSAVRVASRITPNAWAVEGFNTLAAGGVLADILTPVAALLVMAAALFALAVLAFRQRKAALLV